MKRKSGKYRGMMQVGGSTPVEMRMQGKQNPFNWMSTNTQCPEGYYFSVPDNQCKRIVSNTLAPAPVTSITGENPAWTNYPPLPKTAPSYEEDSEHSSTSDDSTNSEQIDSKQPHSNQSNLEKTDSEQARSEQNVGNPTHNWNTDVYLGLRGAQVAASYLAGKRRDSLMNEYDYKQQSALGQMNPMPISQFQYGPNDYTTPNRLYAQQGGMINPYSYHSKYGGNLKTIIKEYGNWTNNAHMDFGNGSEDDNGMMKRGGRYKKHKRKMMNHCKECDMMEEKGEKEDMDEDDMMQLGGIQKLSEYLKSHPQQSPHPTYQFSGLIPPTSLDTFNYNQAFENAKNMQQEAYDERYTLPAFRLSMKASPESEDAKKWMHLSLLYGNAFKDAHPNKKKGGIVLDEMVVNDFVRKLMEFGRGPHPYRGLRKYAKGGRFMGINPEHKGYCTPMTKETCTPHRKALAMTLKKHHGFHEAKMGGLTANKAREILHDGMVHGKKITDKQRRFFGAMSKGHTNYRGK